MNQQPAVSVIVLGYNGREHVSSCLGSLLDQDFDRAYEVLFVDNASSDGTAEAAAAFEGVAVHRLDRNYGYCGGNNRGALLAKAPLLVFLNQDVLVHRSWLSELVAAVESDDSVQAAHACIVHPWNDEFAARERLKPIASAYTAELSPLGFVEYRRIGNSQPVADNLFLSGVSIILKRDAIPRVGGYVFDPDMFMYGEDMDLGLRLRNAGYRTVVATRSVLYHSHVLQDSLSLRAFVKTVRIIRNRLLALWKNTDWLEFLPLAAVTLIGAPFNSTQFGLPLGKKVLYFFLLLPPTVVAGVAAVAAMPRFGARRADVLRSRTTRRGWLLRALLLRRRDGRPILAGAGQA